jgi:branched-subunit amino acid transport protein AzlD
VPIEPLHTDEKIEGKKVHEKSMDDVMLTGCTGFVGCSVGTFLLGVWPFLAFGSAEVQSASLLLGFPLGLLPAAILGAFVSRRYGLASACGFVGGAMALAVFMFLIANRMITSIFLASGPRHFYSPIVVYLIPVAWLALVLGVAYVFLPKSELRFWKP